MKRSISKCLVIGVVLTMTAAIATPDEAKDEAIQKDRQQIAGTWRVVALEVSGNQSKEADANKLMVVNSSDGSWSLQSEGQEISRGTSTIDPTQQPKTIDFKVTNGEGKDNQHQGIYELGKNTRRLCFAASGKDRPAEFASTTSNEQILVALERETPQYLDGKCPGWPMTDSRPSDRHDREPPNRILAQPRPEDPKSSQWLREVGIESIAELKRLGPVLAYRLVKQRQPQASLNLLWSLAAGLEGEDRRKLTEANKKQLRAAAEE